MSQIERLDSVCDIVMGQAPKGSSYNTDGLGVPLVAGAGDLDNETIRPKKWTTEPPKLSAPGDILLAIRASIGDRALSTEAIGLGRGVAAIRPGPEVDSRYLWHWLGWSASVLAAKGRGATFKQVSRADIADMSIPLPPMDEQRHIAQALDAADMLRTKRRHAASLVTQLYSSLFLEMFGDPDTAARHWGSKSLIDVCSNGGEYGAGVSSTTFDPSLPRYVRITDIDGQGCLSDTRVAPSGDPKKWSASVVEPGDLLFARSGATVGKTYLHRAGDERCVFAGYLIRFHPNPSLVLPEFLFAFTKTEAYRQWVLSKRRAVAQPNINARQYGSELMVPTPPMELQREFEESAGVMRRLRHANERCLVLLNELFHSLQSGFFAKEL